MVIELTKKVYLDGQKYIRVFFKESVYFQDILAENFEVWREACGHSLMECRKRNNKS
jgi:hypothetical protein